MIYGNNRGTDLRKGPFGAFSGVVSLGDGLVIGKTVGAVLVTFASISAKKIWNF